MLGKKLAQSHIGGTEIWLQESVRFHASNRCLPIIFIHYILSQEIVAYFITSEKWFWKQLYLQVRLETTRFQQEKKHFFF